MGSLPNQQRPLSRVHVCAPGEIFSAESVKPRDLDRAPQRCKKTSTRHKSSKKSQKMPCKVLMRVLILYMAFLWWEKKYPVLRGTEQKPVDPKINRLCFQRRKRGVSRDCRKARNASLSGGSLHGRVYGSIHCQTVVQTCLHRVFQPALKAS